MQASEICQQLLNQFDSTVQGHLAIIGSIALNVIMLVRVWLTTRNNSIEIKSVNQKLNGS